MQHRVNGILDLSFESNNLENFDRIVLLLHGYSESGEKIFKRLLKHLPENHLVIAPNGPFPLVDRFPLETTKSSDKLLRGYAWYFYDQKENKYIVDYAIPVSFLNSLISKLNPAKVPVSLIGYSQGGYLAPFLAAENELIEDVFGINCSYRHDLFPTSMKKPIYAFQGSDDPIIDVELAKSRHENYGLGDYQLIENENHRLSQNLAQIVGSQYCEKHN